MAMNQEELLMENIKIEQEILLLQKRHRENLGKVALLDERDSENVDSGTEETTSNCRKEP